MTGREREQLGEDLSAYLDGELAAERAQEVERLLSESAEARALLEELRGVSAQLGALPRVLAPDAVTSTIVSQAERQLRSERARQVRRAWVVRFAGGVAAAAAVLVGGVWIGYEAGRRSPAPIALQAARPAAPAPTAVDKLGVTARELAPGDVGEITRTLAAPKPEVAAGSADRAAYREQLLGEKERREAGELAGSGAPLVRVVVQPRDDAEYAAAVAMLRSWAATSSAAGLPQDALVGAEADRDMVVPASARPVAQSFGIPVAELPGRIGQLEGQAPQGVYVQVGTRAGGAALPAQAEMQGGAMQHGNVVQPAAAPACATQAKDERAAAAKRTPKEERAGQPSSEKPAAAGRGPEKKPEAASPRSPASRAAVAKGMDANSVPAPASLAVWSHELTDQMLGLLFTGAGELGGGPGGPGPATTSFAQGGRVTLRVLLLPVSPRRAAASQPNEERRE